MQEEKDMLPQKKIEGQMMLLELFLLIQYLVQLLMSLGKLSQLQHQRKKKKGLFWFFACCKPKHEKLDEDWRNDSELP